MVPTWRIFCILFSSGRYMGLESIVDRYCLSGHMTAEFKNQLVKASLQQQQQQRGGGGGGRELMQKGGMITIPNQAITNLNTTAGANGSIGHRCPAADAIPWPIIRKSVGQCLLLIMIMGKSHPLMQLTLTWLSNRGNSYQYISFFFFFFFTVLVV